jgi:hypothetical protein
MTDEQEQAPQFPQYRPPGIQQIDPRQQKPLTKMLKFLAKPLKQRDPFHSRLRGRKKMKQVKFY